MHEIAQNGCISKIDYFKQKNVVIVNKWVQYLLMHFGRSYLKENVFVNLLSFQFFRRKYKFFGSL